MEPQLVRVVQLLSLFKMRNIILLTLFIVISCKSPNQRQAKKDDEINSGIQRADLFEDEKKWDKALQEYVTLIKLDPNNADFYFQKGYLNEMLFNYKECIEDFNKVIEINPNKNLARTNRGYAYRMIGEYEKAIQDFTDELRIHPNPYSNEHRGYVKYLMKNYDEAIVDISRAIELDPENSIAYKSRALVYFAQNKIKEGCEDIKKANSLNIKTKFPDYKAEIETMEKKCIE